MSSGNPVAAVAILFLAACGNAASQAPSASAQASAPAASTHASPSAAPVASTAVPSASVSAAAPSFEQSAEPELAEWGKVREIKVGGSGKNSCETKLVREWLRVMCVNRAADLGKPVSIEVTKGRGPKDRSQGENLKAVNDITTLVVPVRPGSDIEATFTWENGEHKLTATWPEGKDESQRTITFDNAEDAPVHPTDSADKPAPHAPEMGGSSSGSGK